MIVTALLIALADDLVRTVARPDTGPNDFYVGNRAPLRPSAFRKLPIGAIRPEGWVREQLVREASGFTGHLEEISSYLSKKNNAWLSPTGEGEHGWEEVPYWLKGYGDLGYVLDDKRIMGDAESWVNAVMKGQREDGWFGPRANLKSNNGRPDVWPNMVMLNALQSYYERTGDQRVIGCMRRYFRWELSQPDDDFLLSYWERQRGGDNMASVYWLYNRTGETWLLDLVKKLHRRTADWISGVPNWHGVNFAQGFREPAEYGLLTRDGEGETATERDYHQMRGTYGLVPGGMYGADENARPGYTDPRQATETCSMVEMMLSDEMLLEDYGDPRWAERCEDVAFNSLPASMTPDLKALHYLTAPNMPISDARSKAPGVENSGPMFLFNPWDHRCCQHNVSHGWPYYAERLWMAAGKNGLAAALYAPCEVTARAGDGTPVTIKESTEYPFRQTVTLNLKMAKANHFPLILRLPGWCASPSIRLNGKSVLSLSGLHMQWSAGAYAILDRTWHSGDRVVLEMPMDVNVVNMPAQHQSVVVSRGPLSFSLKIGERSERHGGTDQWPATELLPTTPWNYGLLIGSEMRLILRPFPMDNQPFTPESSPIEIVARARRIPKWRLDSTGLVEPLPQSPVATDSPVEDVTLIPMGAARLRLSMFPTCLSP
jgi:DUF1680 family protein